jgi:hypothetical protein
MNARSIFALRYTRIALSKDGDDSERLVTTGGSSRLAFNSPGKGE